MVHSSMIEILRFQMFFCIPALAERGTWLGLHLATRFAFFQVMHDLRVLLIQAVKQQG